jgi:hypothetical protein
MDILHGQIHAANALPLEKETLLTTGQVDGWTSETVKLLYRRKIFPPLSGITTPLFQPIT